MARRVSFMDRASFGATRASSIIHRDLYAQFLSEDFNSSLGSPLSSYEDATLALVGGKALQCWRLMKHGLPVPSSFVIPTFVYSLHVRDAGVEGLIDEVFRSDLRDEKSREEAKPKLDLIREKIKSTPLKPEVVENLESFMESLPAGTTVAVRSSGSAEDLASQSFAGQYETFLYQQTTEEVCESVKGCWASMFQTHILDYAWNAIFMAVPVGKEPDDPNVFAPGSLKPPQMGVLIMTMVDARASGVCFTNNLWGLPNEILIEAVMGQGEGLVGGEITPNRFVVNKLSATLVYQTITPQTHKFVRSSGRLGVEKVDIDPPYAEPVLSAKDLHALNAAARAVESFYNRPQDIEWAIDHKGKLFILQARPITTLNNTSSLSFLPPGDGFWTFDPTHFPRPVTPWLKESYSFEKWMHYGRRTGCLIKDIKLRYVHNFAYTQPVFYFPGPDMERAAEAYWSKKMYEDDYREFTDFFRPELEELQEELQSVNPSSLSHRALVLHVARCFDLAVEFWRSHHTYTIPAVVVIGDFMNRMAALTGKPTMDTLVLLENASPESRGLLNHEDPLLSRLYELLVKNKEAMELLVHPDAAWALDCLVHMPDELGEVMRKVLFKYGWRLAGGYDLIVPALIEEPEFFLRTLYQGAQEDPDIMTKGRARVRQIADEWKSALDADKHEEFEEILDIGQRFFRLRDERGLATDLSGIGLCRRGILEAGRRLAEQGVLYKPEHLTVTTKHEALSLLRGDFSLLPDLGTASPVSVPTPRELQRRYDYIAQADPNLIPRALGNPSPPPDPMSLPPNIRRTMAAVHVYLFQGIWDEGQDDDTLVVGEDMVKGVAASLGVVEGPACLILKDGDLKKVKKGDIIITYSCSASFNVVLALCGGICTDYGGMLSHAAIVAREYGIPAVVGTQDGTKKFQDGDIVRVNGSNSTVVLVKRKNAA